MSKIFRVQENTPSVYYDESRDFQLLGRLYDCIINGFKYDIDTMSYLTDTKNCKSVILQLLQTKLGFFSNRNYNDDDIRYILRGFPTVIKNKGSLLAIQEAINVFLKLNHIKSTIKVWYVSESEVIYGTQVDDHVIVIGLDETVENYKVLYDLMKYILPTGFGFYFYFYNSIDETDQLDLNSNATLIYVSDNLNSQVRGETYSNDALNRLLNAVDTVYIASDDSIVPTVDGTYNITTTNKSLFLGVYNNISEITVTPKQGQYCVAGQIAYYYDNSNWQQLNFKGIYETLPTTGRHKYDIVGQRIAKTYYYRTNDTWNAGRFIGDYEEMMIIPSPTVGDIVRIAKKDYYYYSGQRWIQLTGKVYKEKKLTDITDPEDLSVAILEGVTFWFFNGTAWIDNTLAIYMLITETNS